MIVVKTNMKEIPKNCDKCPFYSEYLVWCFASNRASYLNPIPDWCPLIEVKDEKIDN